MHRLFEGSAYLRAFFISKLDVKKICFNYSVIIFHIKLTELMSFNFDFTGEAELF